MKEVSIVLPVYNESADIRTTFEAVRGFSIQHPSYRFIFVNDGSTDETKWILESQIEKTKTASIELVSYENCRGKGWAVKQGVELADGEYVCFIDGDLAYSLDHLEALVDKLQVCDVAIGCRNLAPMNLKDVEPFRRLSGKIFNWISRKILNLNFRDMQAGLKGFRVAIAHDLFRSQKVMGFAFDAELLYLARQKGYLIGEIPAFVSKNHKQKVSKVNILKDSVKMFISLISIRYFHRRHHD